MKGRIALFGVLRGGKDRSIEDALEIACGVPRHVSSIGLVHEELAEVLFPEENEGSKTDGRRRSKSRRA